MMGLNPRKMNQMMRKMGIKQQEIEASEVIIKTKDSEIIITNPQVSKVNMMGQESFQISGSVSERSLPINISEEDINTVIEQTNVSKEKAKKAIEEAKGDLAQAIISLQNQ